MIKRIHVNQHVIKANRNKPVEEHMPPLTVKTYQHNHKAHEVWIDGPSRLVYKPDDPLSCGARVWIETKSPVTALLENDEMVEVR